MPPTDEFEVQPQAFDARKLEPARKRRRSTSPNPGGNPNGNNGASASPSTPAATAGESSSEPVRKQKRPGQRARITDAEREAIRLRQLERERAAREEEERLARQSATSGPGAINDVVRAHYNAVPERGRDWRKTDSKIKGLRSFNNWVKSCIIQKFAPDEDHTPGALERGIRSNNELLVLDIGCGKGGDLGKWQQAPQRVQLYVGLDPAEVSIEQARERYRQMASRGGGRGGRGGGRGGYDRRPQPRIFDGRFQVKDCFGGTIGDVDIVHQVGFTNSNISGPRGFDVVSMMFCMHYAFETEEKARQMLRNVAGSLKKGGRFIGTIPNSHVIGSKVEAFNKKLAEEKAEKERQKQEKEAEKKDETPAEDGEVEEGEAEEPEKTAEWGNDIYHVRFPGPTPEDGIFRPPFGWKYSFFLHEAVEEVPEYVVPWEAFRSLADDYNLELQYHKTFKDVWESEKDDRELGPLSERMGVRDRNTGELLVSDEEMDAANFYIAFCFYKV
ncbi:S-adenosyl-L-methionine-dependent methyltransferase [Coniochaeta sp. 2T2.1]|nr:S-adenosyl-L-methionine-dependent methyltransferase [Coniochaeta sp. 2T2.1]